MSQTPLSPKTPSAQLSRSDSCSLLLTPPEPEATRLEPWLRALLLWSLFLRLAFASVDLNQERYWDEIYSLENVEAILKQGSLRPANGWYPSLSYLPQTIVLGISQGLHWLTGSPRLAVFSSSGFTASAYFLCRSVQVIFGVLSLWVLFRLGRRLFSSQAGLLAALLLAVTPVHIRLSTFFKPDILTLLLVLLTLEWSFDAAERPSRGTYMRVGAGIGLAASAKFTGGAVLIPLVVASLAAGGRRARKALWLAAAGLVAVMVFVALNPYFSVNLVYLKRNLAIYAERGQWVQGSHLGVLLQGLAILLSRNYHGWIVGGLGVVGGAVLFGAVARGRAGRTQRLQWGMLLSYGLGYSLLYAASTTYAKENNFLLVSPILAMLAAAVATGGWHWAAVRIPRLRQARVVFLMWLLPVGLLVFNASAHAYRTVVPTTHRLAARFLRQHLQPLPLREVVYERQAAPFEVRRGKDQAASRGVADLGRLAPAELDLTDAEIFESRQLEGENESFFVERIARVPAGAVKLVEKRILRARGPSLVIVLHPWELAGSLGPVGLEATGERAGRFCGRLAPEIQVGDVVSVRVALRRATVEGSVTPILTVGTDDFPLISTRTMGQRDRLLSPRFRVQAAGGPICLDLPADRFESRPPPLESFLWLPAAGRM